MKDCLFTLDMEIAEDDVSTLLLEDEYLLF